MKNVFSSFILHPLSFRTRSAELEHLDKGDYTPEEYEGCISELQRINRWLGDTSALRRTLLREIEKSGGEIFSLLDVGAGSGELLRVAARWTRAKNFKARLVGLEFNARSAQAINEQSYHVGFNEILAVQGDALKLPFADASFDYVLCSLFTHHFADEKVVEILREMRRVARRGVYVIDLHRHPLAYAVYRKIIARFWLKNRLTREDGALSILRSFKPDELLSLAHAAGLPAPHVVRKFPYRLVLKANL